MNASRCAQMVARLFEPPGTRYWLTRFVILRLLGIVYLVAFLSLFYQLEGLIGSDGLLPADRYLDRIRAAQPDGATNGALFMLLPSIYWFHISDGFMLNGFFSGWAYPFA